MIQSPVTFTFTSSATDPELQLLDVMIAAMDRDPIMDAQRQRVLDYLASRFRPDVA